VHGAALPGNAGRRDGGLGGLGSSSQVRSHSPDGRRTPCASFTSLALAFVNASALARSASASARGCSSADRANAIWQSTDRQIPQPLFEIAKNRQVRTPSASTQSTKWPLLFLTIWLGRLPVSSAGRTRRGERIGVDNMRRGTQRNACQACQRCPVLPRPS
jgi:hypothetical protein